MGAATLIMIILIVLVCYWVCKYAINHWQNKPTPKGIIISAFFGMLPLYLFCCWIGWFGEKENKRLY